MKTLMTKLTRLTLTVALLASLQACSGFAPASNNVAEVFESSGTVAIKPYNRSIFSSENF